MTKKILLPLLLLFCPSSCFLHSKASRRDVTLKYYERYQNPQRVDFSTKLAKWDGEWEGDDLRFLTRLRRRMKRNRLDLGGSSIRTTLILLNLIIFLYQTVNTVDFIRRGHSSYWPRYAPSIILDSLIGSSVNGPVTMNLCFANSLSHRQPHRYLTSGFIHYGIVNFLINMIVLRNQPSWLASGLGVPLYLTTYFVSIVTGNLAHLQYTKNPFDQTICMGSTGAIAGLYGLMYVSLIKMGNSRTTMEILKGLGLLFVMGFLTANPMSTSILGGFVGGVVMGILCAPGYEQSYSLRRKNSVEFDPSPRDYRTAMGFGIVPKERGLIPLPMLWSMFALLLVISGPEFRAIPSMILKGFFFPGSLIR